VDGSLACKDRHEAQVRALETVATRNLLQAGRVGSVYRRNAIFYFLVGILFAGFGLMQVRWLGWQGIFLMAIGVFLLYAAIANYLESRKY
jgi:sulfite exporter TauE/SafE